MLITVFESLKSKEAHGVIDAAVWIRAIRDGRYKPTVDKVRSMINLGDKDKAREWKMKLPASVWSGDCRTGRFFKNTRNRTGCATFDFDGLEERQIEAARQLLEVFPWIAAIHVTASGRGLRVIANIGIVHIDVYRHAYEIVAQRLHDITGLDPDMACKDFARASLASYDPDAYYNPDAEVFPYTEDSNPLNYIPATGPDPSEDFRYLKNPVVSKSPSTAQTGKSADVDTVISRFFSRYNYTEGSRTRTMLYLGLFLARWGVESWQLDEAVAKACIRGVQPGITEKEIRRAVEWGYRKGCESGKIQPVWGQKGQKIHMYPFSASKTPEMSEKETDGGEENDEEEIIEAQCLPFDDDIFDQLPESIKKLLSVAKDKRERDVSLISILSILSTMFPALRTIYGNRKYSAHMYVFIVAEAGAGKGTAMNASILAKKTDKELECMYARAKKEYEQQRIEWEIEYKNAVKENRVPDVDKKPEEPCRQMLIATPNTSKSQMIITVRNAGNDGLCIITSEADAMVEALHTEYGNHAAELRMFFHHEEVQQHFKVDKEPVIIEHPRVAMLLTGTPDQAVSLVRNTENGLFSRFFFYMLTDTAIWKSQSPLDGKGGIDVEELYGELGEMLKSNFFNSRGKEIMIHFTRGQWDRHDEVYGTELGMVAAEGMKGGEALVKRSGLIAIRIAMVLCGIRIMEAGWQVTEYTCTDEDFDTAIRLALSGMNHSVHVSTMLDDKGKRSRVKVFFRLMPILNSMPSTFRYSQFCEAVVNAGMYPNAAKRSLKKYVASGLLSKTNGTYTKTRKLKKGYI